MPFGSSKQFGGDRFGAVGRFGAGRFGEAVSGRTPVVFSPTVGALTVTIGLAVKAGTTAVIDWGNGATTTVSNSGSYSNYSHTYASAGTYNGAIRNKQNITHVRLSAEAKVAFSVTGMPLAYLYLTGTGSAVTGVITNMPLTFLRIEGTGSSVIGVITGMPLAYLYLTGTGSAVTGVITNMPHTYLYLNGTGSAITGVLASTSRLTREYIATADADSITLPDNRVYGTWGSDSMRIEMLTKLTATQTDATINRLAASPILGATKTVYIRGAARTSASDAAYAILIAASVTVTITG